jgi:hypothetical protein
MFVESKKNLMISDEMKGQVRERESGLRGDEQLEK